MHDLTYGLTCVLSELVHGLEVNNVGCQSAVHLAQDHAASTGVAASNGGLDLVGHGSTVRTPPTVLIEPFPHHDSWGQEHVGTAVPEERPEVKHLEVPEEKHLDNSEKRPEVKYLEEPKEKNLDAPEEKQLSAPWSWFQVGYLTVRIAPEKNFDNWELYHHQRLPQICPILRRC